VFGIRCVCQQEHPSREAFEFGATTHTRAARLFAQFLRLQLSNFNAPTQTLGPTGTYKVVVDPTAANTGTINVQVT
jgi:hypothetical protein